MDTITKEKTLVVLHLWAGATFLIVFTLLAAETVKGGIMNAFWIPTALAAMFLLHRLLNKGKLSGETTVLLICILFSEMMLAHWYVGREFRISYAGDETAQMLAFGKYLASAGGEGVYNRDYFVRYPQFYGGAFVLSLYYRAANLITGSYTEEGLWILNQMLIDSAIALAVVYGHMLGKELQLPALGLRIQLLCLLSPCYYLFQNLVCIQTLGMPLLMGGMVLTNRMLPRMRAGGKTSLLSALLVGLYWGLTCMITPLGYFFFAAWLLTAFFLLSLREFALWAGTATGAALILAVLFSLVLMLTGLQTTQDIQQSHRPAAYWLMVGLEPEGETEADRSRMDSLATLSERSDASWRVIGARAKKLGLDGIVKNSFHKVTAHGWQTGLFGELENVNGTAYARKHNSVLDQLVSPKGLYTYSFIRYANVLWIVTLFGAVMAYPMVLVRQRYRRCGGLLALNFGLYGILLLGMAAQSKPRYILEIAPAVMVSSVYAFSLLARLPETVKTWRNIPVCQTPFFTELEADVEAAILRKNYREASRRAKFYSQMANWTDYFLNTTSFMQFESKRKAMNIKVEELNERNHLIEKNRTFQEIWSNVNSCTARELTTAKASGEHLLQELLQYNDANDYSLEGVQQTLQKKLIEIQKRLTALQSHPQQTGKR